MSNVLLVLKETLWPLTPSLRAASPKLASCLTTSSFFLSVFCLCTPPSPWYPALASWQTNSHSCKAEALQQSFTDSLCPLPKLSVSVSVSPLLMAPSSHPFLAPCTFITRGYSGPSSSQRELKLHSPAVAMQVRRSRSGLFFLESRQKPAQRWKEFDSIQLELLLSKYKSKFVLGLKLIITEMAVTSLASYTQTAIFWVLFLNLTSQKLFKGEILKKN